MKGIKENQMPKEPPAATPKITPEMVQAVSRTLETEGLVHYMEGGAYVPTERGWKFLRETEPAKEVIEAYGDANIVATDITSLSITKFKNVKKGDTSIIGIRANKGCTNLNKKLKDALKTARKVIITIEVGEESDVVTAFGSPALRLTDSNEIFIRKGDFIDSKTLAILADKAAADLKENLKKNLKTTGKIKMTLEIK
jgi:hypothetical protein